MLLCAALSSGRSYLVDDWWRFQRNDPTHNTLNEKYGVPDKCDSEFIHEHLLNAR